MSNEKELIPKLFRAEFSKMVAVISKLFGLQHIEIAEDIVSETFLSATETWATKGIPSNPTAWLYVVAKNKTQNYMQRHKLFTEKITPDIKHDNKNQVGGMAINFSPINIKDSQLQMMFAMCNPAIAGEAQIGLALRILCGFSIDEIAEAFISNKENINKRLYRAKEKLRLEKVKMEFPSEKEMTSRLDNVLHTLYLLFNEGYYSTTQNQTLRKDLCLEALRLCLMLVGEPKTNLPKTNALIALMCFHASRFDARLTQDDNIVLYGEQDESKWDKELMQQGNYFLTIAAKGNEITTYHLEAAIGYWHCIKNDTKEKWEEILQLHNKLLQVNYSPSAALNRMYALYKARGYKEAIQETEKLNLSNNHFYYTLLGELYSNTDEVMAKAHFEKAFSLAKNSNDKHSLQKRIDLLK